jgi:hypothetical protein
MIPHLQSIVAVFKRLAKRLLDVRFGSLADIAAALPDVRFTPESGPRRRSSSCPLSAMCGRLRVGKENLHVALLVGAAMCSAFERGSHDR